MLRGVWGGVEGERMHARLRGDAIPLPVERNQTIGHSHVLPPYLRTVPKSHAVLHRLLQKAAMRLRNIGYYAGALTVHLNYYDDVGWSDELRLTETQDTLTLTIALNRLWARRPAALRNRAPFQVGLVLTRMLPPSCHTPDLFHHGRIVIIDRLRKDANSPVMARPCQGHVQSSSSYETYPYTHAAFHGAAHSPASSPRASPGFRGHNRTGRAGLGSAGLCHAQAGGATGGFSPGQH